MIIVLYYVWVRLFSVDLVAFGLICVSLYLDYGVYYIVLYVVV